MQDTNLLNVIHLDKSLVIVEQAVEGICRIGEGPNARKRIVDTVLTLAVPLGRTFGHTGSSRTARIISGVSFAVIFDQECVLQSNFFYLPLSVGKIS
jgi:hypothetical protein